jgi:hypothetical protein
MLSIVPHAFLPPPQEAVLHGFNYRSFLRFMMTFLKTQTPVQVI